MYEQISNINKKKITIKQEVFQSTNTQIKSKVYKDNMVKIMESFNGLEYFTENLERKIDNLLKAQQNQFVQSYIMHMKHLKKDFKELRQKLLQHEKKIKYYENEGEMSNLIKKVGNLEIQTKRLYTIIEKKDKKIRDLQLMSKVHRSQLKRYQQQIKQNFRQKNFQQQKSKIILKESIISNSKEQLNKTHNPQLSTQWFPTEVLDSLKKQTSILKGLDSKNTLLNNISQKSVYNENLENNRRKKQIRELKMKNKKLISYQTKVMSAKNETESFFEQTINEIKKQIKIRRKINNCTFSDFRRQDKINLLIKVLSNDEILSYLHQRLFNKNIIQKKVRIKNQLQQLHQNNKNKTKKIIQLQSRQHFEKNIISGNSLPKIHFDLEY